MTPSTGTEVELTIGGMTCASCANRIERKLNKLDGVQASVNYATEKARVQVPAGLDPALLVAQVEAAGYTAALPGAARRPDAGAGRPTPDPDSRPAARPARRQRRCSRPRWSRWRWCPPCSSPTGSGSR